MKKFFFFMGALAFSTSALAQNVGVSTNGVFSPSERLHVDGNARIDQAFMMNPPASLSPGATITIGSQTSVAIISNNGGTQANAISYTGTAGAGQILYIYNGDNDAATFAGTTVPAGGMGTFLYLSGTWRTVSSGSSSGSPTGAAGGDLTGTYPNPSVAGNAINSAKIQDGTVANADLVNSSVTINTSSGISGGGTLALGGTLNLTATDGSTTNELQTISASGNGPYNIDLSNSGGSVTLTPGTAIGMVRSGNNITVNNTGVTSISAGTTGLTPASATAGAVTLAGTLNPASGGTGINTSASTGVPSIAGGTWTVNTVLPVSLGGTGSSTQGWVDLTTNQSAAGNKTWTGNSTFNAANNTVAITNAGANATIPTTYPLAVQRAGTTEFTAGSDATNVLLQSWNSKPLLINSQGNNVAVGNVTPLSVLHVYGAEGTGNSGLGVILGGGPTGNAKMELRGGTPYVDYSNDNSSDFDARVILNGDDELALVGANYKISNMAGSGNRLVQSDNTGLLSLSAFDPSVLHTGSGANGQVTYWTGTYSQAGTNSFFWDNANARLGIGTNGPNSPLTVRTTVATANARTASLANGIGDTNFELAVSRGATTNAVGDVTTVIGQAYNGSAITEGIRFFRGNGSTDGAMAFVTNNGTERVRINATGDVGINMNAPTAALHIAIPADENNNPANNGIYVYNAGNAGDNDDAIITARVNGAGAGDPFVSFDIDGVQGYSMGIDNSDLDKFKISYGWDDPGLNPRLTIDVAGNVGIGNSSPAYKLDVNGNLRSTIMYDGDNTAYYVDPAGFSNLSRTFMDNGVIQRGGAAITGTSDLGLYSRVNGNWIRIVTNAAPIRFFLDDGTGTDSRFSLENNGNLLWDYNENGDYSILPESFCVVVPRNRACPTGWDAREVKWDTADVNNADAGKDGVISWDDGNSSSVRMRFCCRGW